MQNSFFQNKVICFVFLIVFLSSCDKSPSKKNSSNPDLRFVDISLHAGFGYELLVEEVDFWALEAGGVAVHDYNNDGFLDFFVTHGINGSGRLFKNNGDGSFSDVTEISRIMSNSKASGALFFDVDGDDINDLLITQSGSDFSERKLLIYKNNGSGIFEDISNSIGLNPVNDIRSLAAGDITGDGKLEIAMAPHGERAVVGEFHDFLWEEIDGYYSDITNILPIVNHFFPYQPEASDELIWGFVPSFSDITGNGDLDLLFISSYGNTQVYLNNSANFLLHPGKFTDEDGMGLAIGDYDNDGDLDFFVSSIWHPDKNWNLFGQGNSGNRLYNNDGNGNFSDVTETAGVRIGYYGWGACFADFNNDGFLDLFHVNGWGDSSVEELSMYTFFENDPAVFFLNNGDGTFSEIASKIGINHSGQGRGISCLDFDNDGDIDILISNNGAPPTLYRNDLEGGNYYLKVELKGLPRNHQGIGAKIWAVVNGSIQLREVRLGSNYLSNDPVIAHFGFSKSDNIDYIKVEWNDADNSESLLENVRINQKLVITHPRLK